MKIESCIQFSLFKKVQCWRNKLEIKLQFFFCAVKIENWIMYSIYNFLRKCNVEFVLERCVLIFNAVENGLAETYMHPDWCVPMKGTAMHIHAATPKSCIH